MPIWKMNFCSRFLRLSVVPRCRERPQIAMCKPIANRNTKFSNLSSQEWAALKNLSKRNDIVVKPADKGGAVVVWRSDLYQKEALWQHSDTSFYAKI